MNNCRLEAVQWTINKVLYSNWNLGQKWFHCSTCHSVNLSAVCIICSIKIWTNEIEHRNYFGRHIIIYLKMGTAVWLLFRNFSSFDRILCFIQVTYQKREQRNVQRNIILQPNGFSQIRWILISFFWFINRRACVCDAWLLFVWKLLLQSNRKLKQFYRISHALPNRLDTLNSLTEH